jgi:hypothetical protein
MSFFPFVPPTTAVSLSYIGTTNSTASADTYTMNTVSIGTASSDRLVVAVVTATGVGNRTLTSITCGGVAMTEHLEVSSDLVELVVASLLVPSGTTANFVTTWNDNKANLSLHVYTLKNYDSATPTDTDSVGAGTNLTTADLTFSIEDGGVAVLAAAHDDTSRTVTWESATETYDQQIGGEDGGTAGAYKLGPATSHTETITWSGTANDAAAAVVCWR